MSEKNLNEFNLYDLISNEEKNLLTSLLKLKKEFSSFTEVDRFYIECIKILNSVGIKNDYEEIIYNLFYFSHFYFYFSTISFLRGHQVEAFNSLRKALDGSLISYYLTENKNEVIGYIKRENKFKYIKNTIKKEMEKDPKKFIFAKGLIDMYEICSTYASHADLDSFTDRIFISENNKDKSKIINFSYFTFSENEDEYKFYFVAMILTFLYIFRIFKIFMKKKLGGIVIPNLEKRFNTLESELQTLKDLYQKKFKK